MKPVIFSWGFVENSFGIFLYLKKKRMESTFIEWLSWKRFRISFLNKSIWKYVYGLVDIYRMFCSVYETYKWKFNLEFVYRKIYID